MEQSSKSLGAVPSFIARTSRFGVRFLLVLTTLSAIGVLWWQDRQRLEKRMQEIAPSQSQDWRSLGVAMLHHLIIEELLGQRELPKSTYVHLVDEVGQGLVGKLEGNLHYPLAALVMPATVSDVRKVSLHNERMPAKSTYFYPKLLSGLVVNPLNAN